MSQLPSNDMEAFRKTLRESKHIIAVAGAGLSAASGELRSTSYLQLVFKRIVCALRQVLVLSEVLEVYGEGTML